MRDGVIADEVVICFLFINFAVEYEPQHKQSPRASMVKSVVICFLFINFAVEYEPQHKPRANAAAVSPSCDLLSFY